jgi:hypothetical protein
MMRARVCRVALASLAPMLVAAAVLTPSGALGGGATAAPKGRHCGLFRASRPWADAEHIKGYFYSYGVVHMECHHPRIPTASDPAVIATLAVDGTHHPYGFACVVAAPTSYGEALNSGYCTKGNPHKPAALKEVVWAPESECAIPDPPYTPETLPAKCHT